MTYFIQWKIDWLLYVQLVVVTVIKQLNSIQHSFDDHYLGWESITIPLHIQNDFVFSFCNVKYCGYFAPIFPMCLCDQQFVSRSYLKNVKIDNWWAFAHFNVCLHIFNGCRYLTTIARETEREIRCDTIATKTSLSEYSKQIESTREIRLCGGGWSFIRFIPHEPSIETRIYTHTKNCVVSDFFTSSF